MITMYGILNSEGTHTDVSKTLQGAKSYATRNGYKRVSMRQGYHAFEMATKEGAKWVNYDTSLAIPKERANK